MTSVYFASCGSRIKIGIAQNVSARLNKIGVHLSEPIELIGACDGDRKMEKAIHEALHQHRLKGEWFRDCKPVRDLIAGILSKAPATNAEKSRSLDNPRWFALMCRAIWGTNAPKELRFQLDKSDRTCRAWSSGDSDPAATILAALLRGDDGARVLAIIMHESAAVWWREHERARSAGEQVLEITKGE